MQDFDAEDIQDNDLSFKFIMKDYNYNGKLCGIELREDLRLQFKKKGENLPLDKANQLVHEYLTKWDTNRDGEISFEEFVAANK